LTKLQGQLLYTSLELLEMSFPLVFPSNRIYNFNMSEPFKLYRLQQIDSQIDQIHNRLKAIESALSSDKTVRLAQKRVEQSQEAFKKEQKNLRNAEQDVQAQRVKIEQSESTLYGGKVRNPKELQDLQNEVASLKRYLSVLEDRQLEAMIAVEMADEKLQTDSRQLEKALAASAAQHKDLSAEKEDLLTDLSRLEGQRSATTSSIPEEDMQIYNQLRRTRSGIAVARIVDKCCSACGTTLNAALLHAARSPNQISRCDGCSRILYSG
jgi:predicted  nucleic acid-binding Zn-ribbon protein